jgi:hypothetical protein
MKIDYFTGGIDSFEMSLEHLNKNTDRDLRASILLGFHGISSLFKAVASEHGIRVTQGRKSIKFPTLIGALKKARCLEAAEGNSLKLLSILRNALEHNEVEYNSERFKAVLFEVLPILERIVREYDNTDLQDLISDESWEILIEIREFYSHRKEFLDEIVEKAIDKPINKDDLCNYRGEAVFCDTCSQMGLPWRGIEMEKVKCKFCGEISLIAICEICMGPVIISEGDEWPYFHDDCWKSYMNEND